MRSLLALLSIALLGICVSACGSTGKDTASVADGATATNTSGTTTSGYYVKADKDKDNDVGAPYDDTNNDSALDFGHAASTADKRAITALVEHYYAAAAADEGGQACSMIISSLAKSVPEDYGQAPGPSYLRGGKTCTAVMSRLFKHSQRQLTAYASILEVSRVRLEGSHGFAVMTFGAMPEREISVVREGRVWKVGALLDSELP